MTAGRDSTMPLAHDRSEVLSMASYIGQFTSDHAKKAEAMLTAYAAHLATRERQVSDKLVTQLRGRAAYLRDMKCVKSPQLMEQAASVIESLASRKVAAHDGYVLVPVEPTREMLESGHNCIDWCREKQNTHFMDHPSQHDGGTTCEQDLRDAYAAMLNVFSSDREGE